MGNDVDFPGSSSSGFEPGLAAVRSKFGDEMVERIRLWPHTARKLAEANYPNSPNIVEDEVSEAKEALERAKRDRDYAIAQAEAILRSERAVNWARLEARREAFDLEAVDA